MGSRTGAAGSGGGVIRKVGGWVLSAAILSLGAVPASSSVRAVSPTGFNNGAGEAYAKIMSAKAIAGSTEIGVDFGIALAKYQGSVGIAEGRAYDLGIIEALLSSSCDGSPPTIDKATINQGIRVDSRDVAPLQLQPTKVVGIGSNPKEVGTQWSGATNLPWAHAGTDLLPLDFGMRVEGAHNEATTQVKDGVRRSEASMTADKLVFMGILTLYKPRWEAVVANGNAQESRGSFTFERARLFGVDLDPKTAERDIMRGLSDWSRSFYEMGLRFDYPEVRVEGDRVEVTPMAIRIIDSPAGKKGVGPFLEAIQPLRQILFEYLLELDCNFATTITILDVLLGVLSGAGGMHITTGGVTVEVDDTFFESPFGQASTTDSGIHSSPYTDAPTSVPAASSPPPTASTALPQSDEVAGPAFEPASSREQMPGETDPAAALAAAALLAVIAGLAAGDFVWMRRTNRRIPDA